nr:reverse transcriptase domain-containing protein [Tanacetum cinerariifolium]
MIPTTSSSPPKVVEHETDVTKDTVPPTNNGSTKDVQPPVIQVESPVPNSELVVAPILEPVVTPVSTPKPNQKPLGRSRRKHKSHAIIRVEQAFLPELCPTCMTLKLADRSISCPVGVVEDVFVKVGTFYFPADFIVVDFDAEPRVSLILGRSFLKTGRALIDVYEGELTLHVGKESVTFNLDQTSRYSANYDAMLVNRIDLIDVSCEEYSQEVLGFFMSGNPTPSTEPIVSNSSATLTPFGDTDFLLEETDTFLAIDDEPISPEIDQSYYDSEGDIILLEEFLNDDPSSPPLPPQELKIVEPTNEKSSINEPPAVELKDLPPHFEYAFLEGDDKLPVIIGKDLKDEEKTALIKVLKSHKQALAWQLFDIKAVQHQRRVNPKIYEVIKREVLKLMDAGLIYPISDSLWEKSHFVVKEGIILGHKISKNGIEVDKAKVDIITKLPYSTTFKGIRSFLGHVGFYRRFIQDILKIARQKNGSGLSKR